MSKAQAAKTKAAHEREQKRAAAAKGIMAALNHPVVKAALHAAELAEAVNQVNTLYQLSAQPEPSEQNHNQKENKQ